MLSTDAIHTDWERVLVTDVLEASGVSEAEGIDDKATRGAEPTVPGPSPAERGITGAPAEHEATEAANDSR